MRYFCIEKEIGETPLHALERGRGINGIAAEVPLTYAGRLDPMASGQLLILVGEECKRQEEYRGLDKVYEVEVLFGARSDTGDILGFAETGAAPTFSSESLKSVLDAYVGPYHAPYPAFSSKPVEGKPLFQWALEGRLDEIEVPLQKGELFDVSLLNTKTWSNSELSTYVFTQLDMLIRTEESSKRLGENFRIDAIRAAWKELFVAHAALSLVSARIEVRCSSGVYMRTLSEDIARDLGGVGLALSIHRSEIILKEKEQ